jgi:hypothetical protein
MKYRLKWALILTAVCGFIAPVFLHFLTSVSWTDPMLLKFTAAWLVIAFLFGLVMNAPPKPFVPDPKDVLPVYRETMEDFRKTIQARLDGHTWSDNDDFHDMLHKLNRILDGNVIRRGR